ncbi:MAG: hypothetical protein HC802_11225 [Caldilineaceae bacterium]|nr:hypothetical protein [Caldilineaceae bacterium]
MNRRFNWSLSILIMFSMLIAACGGEGAPPVGPAAAATEAPTAEAADDDGDASAEMPSDGNPNESPMLWAAVASGELPSLEERLPVNPLVVEPLSEIGSYGGTLRHGSAGLFAYIHENLTRESLTRWEAPLANVGPPLPNLAESWEANEDGTEVIVHLREGIKWSDGELFTSEDIEFYWYDVMLDENATESLPNILFVEGEAPVLEVIDDFTIKFTYPKPYYFFAEGMATLSEIAWPKHYMSEFHPKYNDQATYEDLNAHTELETGRGAVTLRPGCWKSGTRAMPIG